MCQVTPQTSSGRQLVLYLRGLILTLHPESDGAERFFAEIERRVRVVEQDAVREDVRGRELVGAARVEDG